MADVAIRRLERLERENLQLEDEVLESSLPEALADKTKVVKLLVDKWFVDKGFGFGKVPSGEVVFIHASCVQGAEVLVNGTEAWVQAVSDDARAQGEVPSPQSLGEDCVEARERDRERASIAADERPSSRQSWRPSPKEQCPRCAPILRACFATSQLQSAAPRRQPVTALPCRRRLSLVRTKLPSSKASWRTSAVNRARCRREGRHGGGLLRQGHWQRRSPDAPAARKYEASRGATMSRAVAKSEQRRCSASRTKRRRRGPSSEDKEA